MMSGLPLSYFHCSKIFEIPKGIAIGVRRLIGGSVALKGGWVRGQVCIETRPNFCQRNLYALNFQGSYINSYSLKHKGDSIIALGKKIAGPGPYGPPGN